MGQLGNDLQCNSHMEELVLGVADGTITDNAIIDEVLEHLVHCNYCYELYKDYFIIAQPILMEQHGDDTLTLDIDYDDGFIPLNVNAQSFAAQNIVAVLSKQKEPVIEFEIPLPDGALTVRIIHVDGVFDIVASNSNKNNGAKIFLLTDEKFEVATLSNNRATFTFIKPGIITLIYNLKKIITIKLNCK
ncbi:MAG TPA: hypothetical protein PL073_13490 [Spirochaetota bacterium]|nr:hypothetical protein [Spirochaetota bacterium]